MRISEVVSRKGAGVITVTPDTPLREVAASLTRHGIGAVVVSGTGADVLGIVSERDLVRRLHADGPAAWERPAADVMTRTVITCAPDTDLADVARSMTEHRVRHMPVLDGAGRLIAIVSIGDVVKQRIEQLQGERDQLMAYISQ